MIKSDRAIQEEILLNKEIAELQKEFAKINHQLYVRYGALRDLLTDENRYFKEIDTDGN